MNRRLCLLGPEDAKTRQKKRKTQSHRWGEKCGGKVGGKEKMGLVP